MLDVRKVPIACQLHLERVTEYPSIESGILDPERRMLEKLRLEQSNSEFPDASTIYEWNLSTCPSNKIGGYPNWIQGNETPKCACGRAMELLLTFTADECDGGTFRRWLAEEESFLEFNFTPHRTITRTRTTCTESIEPHEKAVPEHQLYSIINAANFDSIFGGHQFIFICRKCPSWPTTCVFQS
jgi:hypothetical protein